MSPWLEDVFLGGDLCNERGIGCDTEGDILASLLDAGGVSWLEDTGGFCFLNQVVLN